MTRTNDGVERVVDVLELLADEGADLGVTEIGARIGVHKATASRLLGTLAGRGLVAQDPDTGRYRVGLGLVRLAGATLADLDVVRAARPVLEDLSERAHETTNLGVLDQEEVVYVDQVTGQHAITMANWIGRRSPVHASSSGKVLMAFGDPELRERLLRGRLVRLTDHTIVDRDALSAQLVDVARRGYAQTVGELEERLNVVAAPVFSAGGRAIAALSISGPAFRLPARDQPRLGSLVRDAALDVSRRMGYRADAGRSASNVAGRRA